jgi:small-conductance mechanosensitive channel
MSINSASRGYAAQDAEANRCSSRVGGLLASIVAAFLALAGPAPAFAIEGEGASDGTRSALEDDAEPPSAPVVIDGDVLFRVRGTTGFPAEERARVIVGRIKALAADERIPVDAIAPVETETGTSISAGSHRLVTIHDSDARLESIDRATLARIVAGSIAKAVAEYRRARSRDALIHSSLLAGAATVVLAAVLTFGVLFIRMLRARLERRFREQVHSVQIQSFQVVRAERIWKLVQLVLNFLRAIALLGIGFLYLHFVLGLFPWTRATANRLLGYVIDPLQSMGSGLASAVPDFIVLVILFFVTRYVLRVFALFFGAVGRGTVTLSGFQPEWADPTYKLVRIGVIVFALVVAYPYIPGSGTEAFKGFTIFFGILFSVGSSSTISNVIAGYMMIYRRAFKVGDRVKIGDTTGNVTERRVQVTHLRTIKNEEVIIPNSTILNSEIVNYSTLARTKGLILHTTVGIGYQTPWRQVEAALLLAAERTPEIMKQPEAFVLQKALADFSITYELNVYCDNAQSMGRVYTELHRNILDVFNEYGIQIMTPAYEGDPQTPKVVPKARWFDAPALPPKTDI